MFNLKTASIEVRKAAWLAGVRDGYWQPSRKEPESYVIVESKSKGEPVTLTVFDVEYAGERPWREIKEMARGDHSTFANTIFL